MLDWSLIVGFINFLKVKAIANRSPCSALQCQLSNRLFTARDGRPWQPWSNKTKSYFGDGPPEGQLMKTIMCTIVDNKEFERKQEVINAHDIFF
jgi:hypothetical protein